MVSLSKVSFSGSRFSSGNILGTKATGAPLQLVGFDWCDKAGILWDQSRCQLAKGVGPGEIMLKEHDLEMLQLGVVEISF